MKSASLRPSKRVLPLAVAAVFLPSALSAQEGGEFPMPVIEVIGKSEDAVSRQTGSVVLIDREALELIQPLSTDDALRRVAGINTATEDETAIVANLGIRGLSASESKSLILEDGVPVAPGLFIGNERYFNPRIQRIERIEVLKGSASLRYGPSTIGGVVNYQTKTPDDGVLLSGRLGSFDTREASIEAGGRSASGDSFAGLVATRAESDGFMDKDYEMTDILVKSGMALSDTQEVGVKFSWYENDANISYRGLLLGDYDAGSTYNPAPDDYFLTDRIAFDLNHAWRLNDQATMSTPMPPTRRVAGYIPTPSQATTAVLSALAWIRDCSLTTNCSAWRTRRNLVSGSCARSRTTHAFAPPAPPIAPTVSPYTPRTAWCSVKDWH